MAAGDLSGSYGGASYPGTVQYRPVRTYFGSFSITPVLADALQLHDNYHLCYRYLGRSIVFVGFRPESFQHPV